MSSLATPQQNAGLTVSYPAQVPSHLTDRAHSSRINSTYSVDWSVIGIRRDAVAVVVQYAGGKYVQAEVQLLDRSNHQPIPGAYGQVRWQGTSGQWTGAVVLFDPLGRTDCEVRTVLSNLDDRSGLSMWRTIWK